MSNLQNQFADGLYEEEEAENKQTYKHISNGSFTTNQRKQNDKQNPELRSGLHLYLDVQMNSELDLTTAHNITESFENRLKQEIPQIRSVTTHIEIEEAGRDIPTIGVEKRFNQIYIERVKDIALSVDSVVNCKDIAITEVSGEQHITLTVEIESKIGKSPTTLRYAHEIATHVQNRVIMKTGAARVIVHTEPS